MKIRLSRELVNELGGEASLEARVAGFKEALVRHSQTVDTPAPTEHSLVASIAAEAGGWAEVEILDPAPVVVPPPQPPEPRTYSELPRGRGVPIDRFRDLAKAAIDYRAEHERLKYITNGTGQALEYRETEAQARSWKQGEPLSLYPFLQAESKAIQFVSGRKVPPEEVVFSVISQSNAWQEIGAFIKFLRRSRKLQVELEEDEDRIIRIVELPWLMPEKE